MGIRPVGWVLVTRCVLGNLNPPHFHGEKKQCVFTLPSLHLHSMNGNKIFVRNLGDRLFSGKILTPKETLPDWHKTPKKY